MQAHAVIEHACLKAHQFSGIGGIGRKIDVLARVVLQIEQKWRQAAVEMHQLEARFAQDRQITVSEQ